MKTLVSLVSLGVVFAFLTLCCPAMAQDQVATAPSPFMGEWQGVWKSSTNRWSHGRMVMEIFRVDDQIRGRVKATYSAVTTCSEEWEEVAGMRGGEKFLVQYDLKGGCGEVKVTLSLNRKGVLVGAYKNDRGAEGSFRLTKK